MVCAGTLTGRSHRGWQADLEPQARLNSPETGLGRQRTGQGAGEGDTEVGTGSGRECCPAPPEGEKGHHGVDGEEPEGEAQAQVCRREAVGKGRESRGQREGGD